jgi:type IV secretion system protein VirB2
MSRWVLLAVALAIASMQTVFAGALGAALPWEAPLLNVAQSLTGPIALSVSLIALMVAGGTLVFGGELSEFARRACVAVLAIAFLVFGAGFMNVLFAGGGAVIEPRVPERQEEIRGPFMARAWTGSRVSLRSTKTGGKADAACFENRWTAVGALARVAGLLHCLRSARGGQSRESRA